MRTLILTISILAMSACSAESFSGFFHMGPKYKVGECVVPTFELGRADDETWSVDRKPEMIYKIEEIGHSHYRISYNWLGVTKGFVESVEKSKSFDTVDKYYKKVDCP